MAIYLEAKERTYLLDLLRVGTCPFWIRDSIAKKIETDIQRVKEISECKHIYGEYFGKKECCTKCGASDVGMGESWELKNWNKEFASSGGKATLKKYGKEHFKELSKKAAQAKLKV